MKTDSPLLKELGPIAFRRSARARLLSIRVKPYQGVVVSVPKRMSMAAAERFVLQKRDWIVRMRQKVKQLEADSVIYYGTQNIRTRWHQLSAHAADIKLATLRITKDLILVRYPKHLPLTSPEVQTVIRKGLIEAYRQEAKTYLPGRVAELALQHGFKYGKVTVKNHRSRWGSCSARNNINLSLHLMRLPDHLVDYVILHELVHTVVKNHSPAFWKALAKTCPQVPALRKEMRCKTRKLRPLQ